MDNNPQVWAEINLSALQRNYDRIKEITSSEIMPIVKANAYGHGLVPVAQALYEKGARRFGISNMAEALELRKLFPDCKIMLVGALPLESIPTIVREEIICGVHRLEQALLLSQEGERQGKKATIHLKIDTGMGRLGFRMEDLEDLLKTTQLPHLDVEGIYTHFATADNLDLTYAKEQLAKFNQVNEYLQSQGVQIPLRHACNSAGVLQLPEAHFDLVRPGIILYGLPPSPYVGKDGDWEPVLTWKTKITHLKTVDLGETISYGRTFRTAYSTQVATLPVGYGDGLRRNLSNCGEVVLNGKRATIIGRICMDQTMIDVTKIPNVKIGDVVTLIGSDGYESIDATEIADLLGTINYEVLCGISSRVPRVYIR